MVETGQVSPKGPRPQRNFLRDYDLMLKVMQQDYVCLLYTSSSTDGPPPSTLPPPRSTR